MLGQSITKNSLVLGAFAALTAGLIALTFQKTASQIAEQERRAAQKALFQIVPQTRHDNDLLNETLPLSKKDTLKLGLPEDAKIHVAKNNGVTIAYIVPAIAPDGYSGDIKLIVGVNIDGSIAGVRVLNHKETPGLGDRIDLNKSDWILKFNDKSLVEPHESKWMVKKDGGEFDQFTGATITPRAVVKQVKAILEYMRTRK